MQEERSAAIEIGGKLGEVGFIHTSIRQSVVHLTSCCGTAWLRSSLRKKVK